MKRYILSIAVVAMTALQLSAQEQSENVFTITSGKAVMKVDAAHGAKVVSLTYDGKEILAQHRKVEGMRFENMNDYGSTFWPSPQSEWNWPPIATYDSRPYAADSETLMFVSGRDEKYPYVFKKKFNILGSEAYEITYTIVNESDKEVSVAPWEITRVPSCGEIRFEAPSLRPEGEVKYTSEDGIITIPFTPERKNRKIFADAKGWVEFCNDGICFRKTFSDISTEEAAPGEDEVEIYWNFGTTYIEVENQGRYAKILPHESLEWTVRWEVYEK